MTSWKVRQLRAVHAPIITIKGITNNTLLLRLRPGFSVMKSANAVQKQPTAQAPLARHNQPAKAPAPRVAAFPL
mgnify:CR=1 FL=1